MLLNQLISLLTYKDQDGWKASFSLYTKQKAIQKN